MRSHRIYSWQTFDGSEQWRCIVAAYSRADAARKVHKLPHQLFNLSETYNHTERNVAMQAPGTVYRCTLVDSLRSDAKWSTC